MPIIQRLIHLDTMFSQLATPPIIMNDLPNRTEAQKESIRELFTTRYSSDMITLLPQCRCGITKGEYSLNNICRYCHTPVRSTMETNIEPIVWFRRPGLNTPTPVAKLLNPSVFIMLKNRFKKSGFNIIYWLTDRNYTSNLAKPPAVIDKIIKAGFERGYNKFVERFDEIMEFLFSLKDFGKKKQKCVLQQFIADHRSILFSDYIPIPNKSLLVVEKTNVGVYIDPIIIDAIDVINTMVSIDRDFYDQSPKTIENRTARALADICEHYEKYFKVNLTPKPGLFRRHIYGSRTNFSFRTVISSITGVHDYRGIEIPWSVGLVVFKPFLINKLRRLGFDDRSAAALILTHIDKYNETLDTLLQEIIAESGGRYTVSLNRNPTLLQGSILRLGISKVKTNPKDKTTSISILIVRFLNADFDGDAVNMTLSLDEFMKKKWYPLEPKFNILQLNGRPLEVSKDLALPKTLNASISNWLFDHDDDEF